MGKLQVGVLVSGEGSLLQAILDSRDETYDVAVVVSDRPGIMALHRAEDEAVPAVVVDWKDYGKEKRAEWSIAVADSLTAHGVGLACSAGLGHILAPEFHRSGIPTFNSHPALQPSFVGAHAVRDALEHGVKVTGTTIHFLTDDLDLGPIILQEAVPVSPDDDEATLHERIKQVERRLYVDAIRLFAQGRLKVEGRKVSILPSP